MFVNTDKGIIKLKYKLPVKLQGQNFSQGEIANNISIPLPSKNTGIFLSGSIGTIKYNTVTNQAPVTVQPNG